MPPTFWVEIEIEGGMGCYRGKTGGEYKLHVDKMCLGLFAWIRKGSRAGE
jgi:hypothetical protein